MLGLTLEDIEGLRLALGEMLAEMLGLIDGLKLADGLIPEIRNTTS